MRKIYAFGSLLIVLVILSLALLSSCATPPDGQAISEDSAGYGVSRYIDREASVACWVYSGYQKGGIDCMPLSETTLKGGR